MTTHNKAERFVTKYIIARCMQHSKKMQQSQNKTIR